jgi:UDP-glucose 4-epimerase
MKVVITGASGNVGTALLRALAGEELVGVARRCPDTAAAPYSSARWVTCDLGAADAPSVLRAVCAGADAVVHLAWAVHPRSAEPAMRRTNATGSEHLLAAVAAAGVPHLVCASSVAAYRPAGRWRRVTEAWPCAGVPGSAYSAGKAALEAMLDEFAGRRTDVRVARIRPCGIVQRDAAAELGSWLLSPLVPPRVLGRRWLPVPLWPGLRLQLVHADDVAQAIRLILTERAAGPFNLAADPVLRAADVAGAGLVTRARHGERHDRPHHGHARRARGCEPAAAPTPGGAARPAHPPEPETLGGRGVAVQRAVGQTPQ